MINEIIKEVKTYADKDHAQWVAPILQVVDGGYGETDKLLGVKTPVLRKLAKKYLDVNIKDIETLLHSEYHEIRLIALIMLINLYKKEKQNKQALVNLYIDNADYINNWDLVDISAPNIVGDYVYNNQTYLSIIYDLTKSKHLWKERIAIVSTQYLIKHGLYDPTIEISEKYLTHPHHLIHKAVGWMLRELGKKNIHELYRFLDKFASQMPRVMLRYAIERMDETQRKYYMNMH